MFILMAPRDEELTASFYTSGHKYSIFALQHLLDNLIVG